MYDVCMISTLSTSGVLPCPGPLMDIVCVDLNRLCRFALIFRLMSAIPSNVCRCGHRVTRNRNDDGRTTKQFGEYVGW